MRIVSSKSSLPVRYMSGNLSTGCKDCSGLRTDKVPIAEMSCLPYEECALRKNFVVFFFVVGSEK